MNLQEYKNGQLSEEDLEHITRKLVNAKLDSDFKNKWKTQLEQEHGIRRDGKIVSLEKRTINSFSYWKIAAAIILLLVVAIPSFFMLQKDVQHQVDVLIAADHFVNKVGGKKGAVLTEEPLREEATLAFNQGKYQTANALYQQIAEGGNAKKSDYFSSGLCLLKLGNAAKSLKQFEAARNKKTTEDLYRQETNWYISLALIKMEKMKEARQELLGIEEGEWKYAEAQELLAFF